ncbi:major facilitator superfamily domain-containing protein [Microdochium bolleyi]|uniref:Major facilitator superfamily domain-containing protein n=1 Tax=Microdochium bolleyi TaxID=196109 RepID=A0A136J475_9PEZI|nr:major facilitator superfamily domain-containing protein [Microdochium bolleyi]
MASLVVSIYVVGFALGPLVFAPLSEVYGRLYIYHHISNILFLIFTVSCALSTQTAMFVTFRLLAGCVIGPVGGGFLNEAASWRWIFWVFLIFGGVTTILGLLFMRETYAPVLLARKAKHLRRTKGNHHYLSQHDIDHNSVSKVLRGCLFRPLRMLFTEPILFILSGDVSIVYGYLYLVFTTLTFVYKDSYGFSSGAAGLMFLGIGIGMFISLVAVGMTSDRIATSARSRTFLIPVGLFWYDWALQAQAFWLVPLVGMGVLGAGIIATFVPIQMYLIDTFHDHAASALARLAMMRSTVRATLPLVGGQMYQYLGYGWGNSLLGFVALALTPIPFLFIRYGQRLRRG